MQCTGSCCTFFSRNQVVPDSDIEIKGGGVGAGAGHSDP